MADLPQWILPSWWFRRNPGAVIFISIVILGLAAFIIWLLYYDWKFTGL